MGAMRPCKYRNYFLCLHGGIERKQMITVDYNFVEEILALKNDSIIKKFKLQLNYLDKNRLICNFIFQEKFNILETLYKCQIFDVYDSDYLLYSLQLNKLNIAKFIIKRGGSMHHIYFPNLVKNIPCFNFETFKFVIKNLNESFNKLGWEKIVDSLLYNRKIDEIIFLIKNNYINGNMIDPKQVFL